MYLFTFISLYLFTLAGCSKSDDPFPKIEDKTNHWIYKTMSDEYLWEIPGQDNLILDDDAEDFFYSLLSPEDGKVISQKHYYFSYIEPKSNKTRSISENEPTYGFEYMSYEFTSGNVPTGEYGIRILYILPNSPAEEAGLKRGDWICWINQKNNPIKDLDLIEKGNGATFHLGKWEPNRNTFTYRHPVTIGPARIVENTPLLKDTICSIGGKKIGYLLYNHFSSGSTNGSQIYNDQMKDIFANFKSQKIEEFVLDLRYNGGGLVSCAQLLSSFLVPINDISKTFCKLKYKKGNSNTISFDRSVSSSNLNLKKLYVLTGPLTASASEAVINGLIPYLKRDNIRIIGMQTLGKTVGSTPFGEKEDYDWILHPITLRITNGEDNADYDNGFSPDIKLYDLDGTKLNEYDPLKPLGDPNELLFAQAINEIIGGFPFRGAEIISSSPSNLIPIRYSMERKNGNGRLTGPEN